MRSACTLLIVGLAAGCGGKSHPSPTTPGPTEPGPTEPGPTEPGPSEPSGRDAPLAWAAGVYQGDAGNAGAGQLHVLASEGAMYAIWLGADQARVWVFDEEDPQAPMLMAWSIWNVGGGRTPAAVDLPSMDAGARVAVFGDVVGTPQRLLTVRRTATDGLALAEAGTPSPFVTGELAATTAARATALEDADRAFATASKTAGAAAWADSVAPTGAMYRPDGFITGPDAVKARLTKMYERISLDWEPIASGLASGGKLGFTVGKARYTPLDGSAAGTGSYVTIWAQQPDGRWKWLLDTGR